MTAPAILQTTDAAQSPSWRILTVACSSACHGINPSTRLFDSNTLTAVEEQTLIGQIRPAQFIRLAPDNPFLSDADRGDLDETGVVSLGTVVR